MRNPRASTWAGAAGGVVVGTILAFVLLPGLVVMIAAFNARAILSFPPEFVVLAMVRKGTGL